MTVLPKAIYRFNAITIKLPLELFTELKHNFSKFIWNHKRYQISKTVEKEEQNWRNLPSWLHIVLQSYSHQDSMVLAQRQKYRPREQVREPRDKPTHLWVPYFLQRRQEYTVWQRQPLQLVVLGKLDSYMQKSETPYTKINSKWIKDLNVRAETIRL